jgi:3-hydroxyacyl-CoA dehydrogenase
MTVHYALQGDIAICTLDNPPVNGLGQGIRAGICDAIARANADPAVRAIVIAGAGKAFCGGADIKEFGTPAFGAAPDLFVTLDQVEGSAKPVVAALHSVCMGGGLELALAAHYRIVAPGTAIAFPEIKLGLFPGAGGTQRLPRVLGVQKALDMILKGDTHKAEDLFALPEQKLFDRLAASPATLADEALAFAREAADRHAGGTPPPKISDLPCAHPQGAAFFELARAAVKEKGGRVQAPFLAIDAVQAATEKPFAESLRFERETFVRQLDAPEAVALRHVFVAERSASKIPDVPADTPLRAIEKVAIIGAGTMGGGIAMAFLDAGFPVRILETKQDALDRGTATIRKNYEAQAKKGKLAQAELDARMGRLSTTLDYGDLADADLIVEAVFEEIGVKEAVFRRLDAVARPGAILASNTSTLDIDRIAEFTARPQDVLGLHFFSPANVMKLLEVVRGEKTAKDVLATAMALAKRLRKTAVVSGVCDGFIGNRMVGPYARQAMRLVDEGATPQQIDRAMEKFGFAMGPFRMFDLSGNDIWWSIRQRQEAADPSLAKHAVADKLHELGRHGQKTGGGWYDYKPGQRDALPSQAVEDLVQAERRARGIEPRGIGDEEIVERLVYALVNEGARILEEGIAARASDIDIVYLTGYGFPQWRGGPMHYAQQVGLATVAQAMRRFAANPQDDAAAWTPAPLLAARAADGGRFD